MTYSAKEIFLTVQGEGAQAGRTAVFLRFAGCNLWNGLERDRASAICRFCDTDFVGTDGPGGGKFQTAEALAKEVAGYWPGGGSPLVVCTGGEPLLQLDAPLIAAFKAEGFEIAIETNGTLAAPDGIDWITVSPKSWITSSDLSCLFSSLVICWPTLSSNRLAMTATAPTSTTIKMTRIIARRLRNFFMGHDGLEKLSYEI